MNSSLKDSFFKDHVKILTHLSQIQISNTFVCSIGIIRGNSIFTNLNQILITHYEEPHLKDLSAVSKLINNHTR